MHPHTLASNRSGTRRRHRSPRLVAVATGLLVAAGAALPTPATAVNADHGQRVVSADPSNVTPHVMNGSVNAVTQIGNKIIAAGTFTSVSPASTFANTGDDLVRNRIFAFDATTGAIDPTFNPNLGGAVNSLDTDGTSIYAGGSFGSVGGNSAISRVVKLTSAGSVVGAFNAVPNRPVNEVVVRGSRLYIGGSFTSVRSGTTTTARSRLAMLDASTGAVSFGLNVPFEGVYDPALGGSTQIKRFDVSADGSRLIAVGNFATVGGLARVQVAMLDTSGPTATVAPWATTRYARANNNCSSRFDTFMRDVDFAPDGSWFAINTTGAFAGGSNSATLCDTTTRWETASTGNNPTWTNYTGGDTLYGVAITGSAVYVGGHQRWHNNSFQGDQAGPGAVARAGIAALDPVNGLPLSWNPGRTRGVGAQAFFATAQGLWVGSDTDSMGGERHARIAFFPVSSGTTVPTVASATLPNDLFLAGRTAGSADELLRRPVDATGAPTGSATAVNTVIDWSTLRGGFLVNGTLYYGLADGSFYRRSFDPATGAVGPQQTVNLYDDPDNGQRIPFAIANLTGTFFDSATHRIYYTVATDTRLFYRYFTPESQIVGAQTFVAESGGVNFNTVAGMTLADGRILYGSAADGFLRSVPFAGGRVTTGSPTTVSADGTWRYRTIFAGVGTTAVDEQPPTAAFTFGCAELTCTFDASGSNDPDGDDLQFAWSFGDGSSGAGVTASRTYQEGGTYNVTVTVTDSSGGVGTLTRSVEAGAAQQGEITAVGDSSVNRNATSFPVSVPAATLPGDAMILFLSENRSDSVVTGPGQGWSQLGPAVTDGTSKTTLWSRVAQDGDAGGPVSVSTNVTTKAAATLLVYRGTDPTSPIGAWAGAAKQGTSASHQTPSVTNTDAGAMRLSYVALKSSSITTLTGPPQDAVRDATTGTGGGRVLTLASDGDGPEPTGAQGGLVTQSDQTTGTGSTWTVMLRPG